MEHLQAASHRYYYHFSSVRTIEFSCFTSPQSIVRMSDVFPMGIASCVWHSNDREPMLVVTRKNSNDKSVDN